MPLVTTDMHTTMERVAGALFWRWSRENFFKYVREELGTLRNRVADLLRGTPSDTAVTGR